MNFEIRTIGKVKKEKGKSFICLQPEFRKGLTNIQGFSHLNIFWWADGCQEKDRSVLLIDSPYKSAPSQIGVFATRSPYRPNPIALSPIFVLDVDVEKGVISFPYIDAENGTPVIDIKPYHPCSDRIEKATVPDWCSHWPSSYEESANFDWEKEFNF